MSKMITSTALAELLGVTVRTVTDLARRGIVVREGRQYAEAESVRLYCAYLRKLATGRGGDNAIALVSAQRARLAKSQADLNELKAAEKRRELVSAIDVEAEWSRILRGVRSATLAVPKRLSSRMHHLTEHDLAEIEAEISAALSEFATTSEAY